MSSAWIVVLVVGAATVALKGAGPVVLGGRALPPRLANVVSLLAPVLLAALVATQVFASGRRLVLDARLVGLAVAAVCIWRRAPVIVTVVLAAAATALTRLR